jgi:class 3 adenylate cyclase
MRVGIHTGQPHRIGSDWLGIDVNIAARVMECTDKCEVLISGATLQRLTPEQLDELGVRAKRVRRAMFAHQPTESRTISPSTAWKRARTSQPSIRFRTSRLIN